MLTFLHVWRWLGAVLSVVVPVVHLLKRHGGGVRVVITATAGLMAGCGTPAAMQGV